MDTHSVLSQAKALQVSSGQLTSLLETVSADQYTLVLIWPQLGDFDTLEYAWWIERDRTQLQAANIEVRAIAIGDIPAGQKFCTYTDFPSEHLYVDPAASLHQELELYPGLGATLPGLKPQQNGYLNLLLMCAGIGSPGTLKEVFRGYKGDKAAPQLIADDEVVKAAPLPALKGEVFKAAGGKGFQRPFELATLRLRNMAEVLSNWNTYVPDAAYLTQRGATFLFAPGSATTKSATTTNRKLVYEWRDRNILGFAENMSHPLSFLENYVPTYTHHNSKMASTNLAQ
ncbi:MAG: peroxiredoxin-like family protein [Cyanobacteria bacterium J06597_16]